MVTMWVPQIESRRGPLYVAIADALAEDARTGRLRPGSRLPTHRELADTLGVTVGTVTRGYGEAARRGLLMGEVGRGTFLRGAAADLAPAPTAAQPGLVDLSLNLPPPLGEGKGGAFGRSLGALATQDLSSLLDDYAPEGASSAHREAGAAWVKLSGLDADPARTLVTSGSQHALTVVFSAFLRPGDLVLTEGLTYPGVKGVAALLNLRLHGLAMDGQGLDPAAFEAACRTQAPRALYTIPTIHNPTTTTMGEGRRRAIVRIARAYGLTIVEDDVHRLLAAADAPPPLAFFAPESVCYLLGTSKTLAPGLRVGFVHAPEPLVPRIAAGIRATTWMAAPLMVEVVARWLKDGTAQKLLKRRRDEARARHRLAAEALAGLRLDAQPTAHHAWLHLPEPWRAETFAAAARSHGVAVTPAQVFQVGRATAPHCVRLGLGAPRTRDDLARGLEALAVALRSPVEASLMLV